MCKGLLCRYQAHLMDVFSLLGCNRQESCLHCSLPVNNREGRPQDFEKSLLCFRDPFWGQVHKQHGHLKAHMPANNCKPPKMANIPIERGRKNSNGEKGGMGPQITVRPLYRSCYLIISKRETWSVYRRRGSGNTSVGCVCFKTELWLVIMKW